MIFRFQEFEGPLDLLLHLVKKKKVDVRDIPISQLADEFINYMNQMKALDIDLNSDFMVTASYLMELKSRALLPKITEEEKKAFEEEKERLYEMIEAYAKVKELVRELERKDVKPIFPIRVSRIYGKIDTKMMKAIKAAIENAKIKEKVYKIRAEGLSVEEMMERILKLEFPVGIGDILSGAKSRYELVVILLAVLELIKIGKLHYKGGLVYLR